MGGQCEGFYKMFLKWMDELGNPVIVKFLSLSFIIPPGESPSCQVTQHARILRKVHTGAAARFRPDHYHFRRFAPGGGIITGL